jgi:Cytochrome c554 and c-prime
MGLFIASLPAGAEGDATAKTDAAAPKPTYIGAGKCKMCHSGAAKGAIYETWEKSSHASALTNLPGDKQKDPACLGCHTTGYGKGGYDPASETAATLAGVGCESCHGPGSEYKAMAVMKDPVKAKAAGLIVPDEKTCAGCHNAKIPQPCWKGADAAPAFVFADAYKKIEHHVPKKTEGAK